MNEEPKTDSCFSEQFESNYSAEKKRARRIAREEAELSEARERDRVRGIFAGTGIRTKI